MSTGVLEWMVVE